MVGELSLRLGNRDCGNDAACHNILKNCDRALATLAGDFIRHARCAL